MVDIKISQRRNNDKSKLEFYKMMYCSFRKCIRRNSVEKPQNDVAATKLWWRGGGGEREDWERKLDEYSCISNHHTWPSLWRQTMYKITNSWKNLHNSNRLQVTSPVSTIHWISKDLESSIFYNFYKIFVIKLVRLENELNWRVCLKHHLDQKRYKLQKHTKELSTVDCGTILCIV